MEESQELKTLEMAKSSDTAQSEIERSSIHNRDEQNLARLGKRQVLKVRQETDDFFLSQCAHES